MFCSKTVLQAQKIKADQIFSPAGSSRSSSLGKHLLEVGYRDTPVGGGRQRYTCVRCHTDIDLGFKLFLNPSCTVKEPAITLACCMTSAELCDIYRNATVLADIGYF